MMLEAQFGSNIAPIERPRLTKSAAVQNDVAKSEPLPKEEENEEEEEEEDEEQLAKAEAAELDRLRALGIPVPGIEIKVDKHVARVWLEDLEVECSYPVLRDRVRVVVERAVETVAGMWAEEKPTASSSSHTTNGNGVEKSGFLEGKQAEPVTAEA
jgi:cleavage and polyadenylation specificity factor subunit 3